MSSYRMYRRGEEFPESGALETAREQNWVAQRTVGRDGERLSAPSYSLALWRRGVGEERAKATVK